VDICQHSRRHRYITDATEETLSPAFAAAHGDLYADGIRCNCNVTERVLLVGGTFLIAWDDVITDDNISRIDIRRVLLTEGVNVDQVAHYINAIISPIV